MNNNNNNNNTDLYNNLKNKQQMFIRCMYHSLGGKPTIEFSRKDLKQIANDHGIAWAPAWIVKDQKRMVKRGIYSVPELTAYCNAINEDALESDHVTIVEDVPAADDMLDVVAECCDDAVDVLKDTTLGRAMTA